MQLLSKVFQQHLKLQLSQPLEQSGEIQQKGFRMKYVFTKDASGKTVLDFLIFEEDGFPPVHKRINSNGEVLDLENFQFSIMYEFPEERMQEDLKMKIKNQKIAEALIKKGLADGAEEWIQNYFF